MTEGTTPIEIRLTGELGTWEVQLVGGGNMHLKAHSYTRQQDAYVFVALAEGSPRYEVELARIPVTLVQRIRGG
jgi:hypothetical protein